MNKKVSIKTIYLLLVISIGLIGLGVGSTYAVFTASAEIDNPIVINSNLTHDSEIIETIEVEVPAKETISSTLNISNSTDNTRNYLVWYLADIDDIEVGTSSGNPIGTLASNTNTLVVIDIRNNSENDISVTLGISSSFDSIVLGEEMISVPSEELPVTEVTLVDYLTNLYLNASPAQATVANNDIYYYYAPSESMMNDGMNSSHEWEDGSNAGNIRYYGATPSNYIDIGDRDSSGNVIPWRIIGVFKNMTLADGSTDTLIKVVRDEYTTNEEPWDDDYYDWHNATLKTYLNEGEYYTGLSQDVKDKIATVEWNIGGHNTSAVFSNEIYKYERENAKCSTCTYETIWEGNIALMYPSDYGYASDLAKCSKSLENYGTDKENCPGTNWIFNEYYETFLTPDSNSDDSVWMLEEDGTVQYYYLLIGTNYGYAITPTMYLKSNLLYDSGDGSSVENAYVVK